MATLTMPRRPVSKRPNPAAEPVEPVTMTPICRVNHHPEAPDRGDARREAPETRVSRAAEAPDAGYQRSNHDDSSHQGRSFS